MGPTGDWGYGYTASCGDQTTGWRDVVSYEPPALTSSNVTSTADTIWREWNSTATITLNDVTATNVTATDLTIRDGIWRSWLNDSTANITFRISDGIWQSWNDNVIHTPVRRPRRTDPQIVVAPAPPIDPIVEQLARLKQKLRTAGQRRAAKERGLELLRSLVTEEQWQEFRRYGSIRERGRYAVYEIGCGWSGHVYELSFDGEPLRKLCVQMGIGKGGHQWTKGDRIAAVLLALRHDEQGLVKMAGEHRWGKHERERVRARRGHLVVVAA